MYEPDMDERDPDVQRAMQELDEGLSDIAREEAETVEDNDPWP